MCGSPEARRAAPELPAAPGVRPPASAPASAPGARPSAAALRLHAETLLASFAAGRGGFVPDAFLGERGLSAAAATVRELRAAGVWEPVEGGHRVLRSEALRMVEEITDALGAAARAAAHTGPATGYRCSSSETSGTGE